MNMMAGRYSLLAYWGPRREDPDILAVRLMRTLHALPAIHPDLASWFMYPEPESELRAAPFNHDDLASIIASGVARADDGDPIPVYGYTFWARNENLVTPRWVGITFRAGSASRIRAFVNTVDLLTAPLSAANETFITMPVMKKIVLALGSIWDITWCSVAPWLILDRRPDKRLNKPWFSQAWIAFLSARFAPLVTPPRSVISERTPNGDLLMIATKERFDLDNPDHMAAALEIEDALMPVNALPWPQP